MMSLRPARIANDCLGLPTKREAAMAYLTRDEITEPEMQLITALREAERNAELKLAIEYGAGVWDVFMSIAPHDARHSGRGTGASFDSAWDDITGLALGRDGDKNPSS
jgi:hypothetical protein